MRQQELIKGAICMLSLAMASCSGDIPDKPGGPLESDEVRYLRISISNPHEGTRAPDKEFENGTDEENAVKNLYLDFYDASGKFVVRANQSDIEWQNTDKTWGGTVDDNENWDTSTGNVNVGKNRNGIVRIGLLAAQNVPAYVMCYINPVNWSETTYQTMDALREIEVMSYGSTEGGFAMNNSVYFGQDPLKNQDDVKITGTPIPLDYLYSSAEELKKTDNNGGDEPKVLDIYVERYAAKVQFTAITEPAEGEYSAGGEGIYAYTGGSGSAAYSLTFKADSWTVNADARSMYGVKNFTTEKGQSVPSIEEVNTYLMPWTTWNDKDNFRSYWSSSPAFFAKDFPTVSDNILDEANSKANKEGAEAVGPYMLKYYSYNQIKEEGNGDFEADEFGKLPCRYVLENTVGKPAFESLNPNAAVPSILLVGDYKVNYNSTDIADNTTFYMFGGNVYFDSNVEGLGNTPIIKDALIEDQKILYVKVDENNYSKLTKDNAGDLLNSLEVAHPAKDVRGTQNVPSRFVTLQIKSVPDVGEAQFYTSNESDNRYQQVTAANLNDVNRLLWNQVGVADCYKEGKCYFSIPIQHLGMTETQWQGEANPINDKGVIDWSKVKVGDFGLVRNHVYRIGVKAITGLATGIGDLDNPIVPPADVNNYWIKYNINILNWRIVPPQEDIVL